MKKQTRLILIAMCLLTALCLVAFASCKDKTQYVTITVNVGLDGYDAQTFTVEQDAEFYDQLASYLPSDTNGLTFVGWVDGDGAAVTADTTFGADATVTATWTATYVTEYYLETDDGFVKNDDLTTTDTARLGSTVTAREKEIEGYSLDVTNANNAQTATLTADTVLKLYYNRIMFTVKFDKNYDGATGEMAPVACQYGGSVVIPQVEYSCEYPFGGWNTQANGLGDSYTEGASIQNLKGNVILYAQWTIHYTEEIYVEKYDGSDYVYVLEKTVTQEGRLGNSVSVQAVYDEEHYFLDYDHKDGKPDTANLSDGAVLKAYYSIERFTVAYEEQFDDNGVITDTVRYGQTYTVRAPQDDTIIAYRSSVEGDEHEYAFGETITVSQNISMRPVRAEAPADDE